MPQLVFAGLGSLVLYGMFVFRPDRPARDYFLPPGGGLPDQHAPPPSVRGAWLSFGLLVVCLISVVGIAKLLAPVIESAVAAASAPHAVVGIVIALLVLLPETWAAIRAARSDRLQTSFNLAYGSALASIGLTIPVVVCASIIAGTAAGAWSAGEGTGHADADQKAFFNSSSRNCQRRCLLDKMQHCRKVHLPCRGSFHCSKSPDTVSVLLLFRNQSTPVSSVAIAGSPVSAVLACFIRYRHHHRTCPQIHSC